MSISDENLLTFQARVSSWLQACFGEFARSDREERTHRFLEEAIELAQANGCSKQDAMRLVDYVYSRPEGNADQEVGGVMVTLAGLCSASNISLHDAADQELERNWRRIDDIRSKRASKPKGSPLPQ
jgi:hypothetical protein